MNKNAFLPATKADVLRLGLQLDAIINLLTNQGKDIKTIMANVDKLAAAIAEINTATNEQSTVLAAESVSLQKISDKMDALIAKVTSGEPIPESLVTDAQAASTHAKAISASLKAQADFSAGVAVKGDDPVPVPVPPVTPTPTPPQP